MVNPLILSTVVIAGVATAVTLEYTIFKPMREGQPILGHQFQEQWHGHFTRFRRKVRRACDPHGHFANGDDSDSDDEGRVEHGHKHDLREMHVRQSDGRAGANDHHGWRADPPPDELRLRRRQAHAVQPVTPDEAWRREMDADLIDFELHERQTRMVQNIARSGLEQAARGGDGGFATDTHRPGVWPQWSDAKPPSSTEHHDDEPVAPHHTVGTESPALNNTHLSASLTELGFAEAAVKNGDGNGDRDGNASTSSLSDDNNDNADDEQVAAAERYFSTASLIDRDRLHAMRSPLHSPKTPVSSLSVVSDAYSGSEAFHSVSPLRVASPSPGDSHNHADGQHEDKEFTLTSPPMRLGTSHEDPLVTEEHAHRSAENMHTHSPGETADQNVTEAGESTSGSESFSSEANVWRQPQDAKALSRPTSPGVRSDDSWERLSNSSDGHDEDDD